MHQAKLTLSAVGQYRKIRPVFGELSAAFGATVIVSVVATPLAETVTVAPQVIVVPEIAAIEDVVIVAVPLAMTAAIVPPAPLFVMVPPDPRISFPP